MSHHGNNPLDDDSRDAPFQRINKELHEEMRKVFGEYPQGKLNPGDSGALAFAVGTESGKVIIRFTKPVGWVGMTGEEALGLAEALIKHARNVGATAPLVLRI